MFILPFWFRKTKQNQCDEGGGGGRYDCETACSLAIAVSVEIADGGRA